MEEWKIIKRLSENLSMTNVLLVIIACVLITNLAKSSDWARDKFQKNNAQVLKVGRSYLENSGQCLKEKFAKLFNYMGNFLKKYKYVFYIIITLAFIGIPILIQCHVSIVYKLAKKMTPGNQSDWIQFWGSYLGIIPSGLVAWLVASKQIESSRKNDKQNHLENMYLDDLKKIKEIMLVHKFPGEWNPPYNGKEIGVFTDVEIDMFRKTFLKISYTDNKEEIRTDELFDVKKIIHGLPLSKRKCIQDDVDKLCDEILKLASYEPDDFKKLEEEYNLASNNLQKCESKNTQEMELNDKKVKVADENWRDKSRLFWNHIQIITEKFNKLDQFVNDELAIYYTL
ncbi:hypothetical protein GZH44_07490 [Weissella hellenica]|nr:hypothetical protein GZH44_07490 [Weissella hellenica]